MEKKVKAEVLAVNDHCLILEGTNKIVDKMPDTTAIDVVISSRAALELTDRHSYDVCILGVSIPGTSGFDLIAKIRGQSGNACIIVYVMHEEIWIVNRLDTVQNFV